MGTADAYWPKEKRCGTCKWFRPLTRRETLSFNDWPHRMDLPHGGGLCGGQLCDIVGLFEEESLDEDTHIVAVASDHFCAYWEVKP